MMESDMRNSIRWITLPCRVGLVISVSASHTVGRGFASWPGHTKDIKMVQTASLHGRQCVRVGLWQCRPTVKKPGSVWNCLWGHALKRSPGINRKSRVLYPGPGFHCIGLIIIIYFHQCVKCIMG